MKHNKILLLSIFFLLVFASCQSKQSKAVSRFEDISKLSLNQSKVISYNEIIWDEFLGDRSIYLKIEPIDKSADFIPKLLLNGWKIADSNIITDLNEKYPQWSLLEKEGIYYKIVEMDVDYILILTYDSEKNLLVFEEQVG